MPQSSPRKLRIVFGLAVFASLSFGVGQVVAKPQPSEASRISCPPGYVRCTVCGDDFVCSRSQWTCVCP